MPSESEVHPFRSCRSRGAGASGWACVSVIAMPERGVVVQHARGLVEIARRYGYSSQELIDIIVNVG